MSFKDEISSAESSSKRKAPKLEITAFVVALFVLTSSVCVLVGSRSFQGLFDKPQVDPTTTSATSQPQPGNVLQEGEPWHGDDFNLTVVSFCAMECGEHIEVEFRLENLTEQDIQVNILAEDFIISLENRPSHPRDDIIPLDNKDIRNQWVEAGDDFEWMWRFTYPNTKTPLILNEHQFNLRVKKIQVIEIGPGLINAEWQGVIRK